MRNAKLRNRVGTRVKMSDKMGRKSEKWFSHVQKICGIGFEAFVYAVG